MGIRVLMTLGIVTLALLAEYAFTSGGVLRWLTGSTAPPSPQPAVERTASDVAPSPSRAAPAARPVPQPASAVVRERFGTLPVKDSFEDGDAGWAFDARGGDGIGARTMDTAYNGHFSLYSQAGEAADRGWPGWIGPGRYRVAPGRTYLLRAQAVSPDGANAWLDLQLYDEAGAWLGGRSTGCSRERPGRDWQQLELRYRHDDPRVAAVGLALLHCLNHTRGHSTTLYFDDVSFGETN